jgi:hypothetical protein
MSTNDIDVAALRHAAASALPGPWHLQTGCSWRRIGTNFGDGDVLCPVKHPHDGWPDLAGDQASWRYIVAAHPGVVTALLDRLEAVERARDEVSAALAETRAQLEKAAALRKEFGRIIHDMVVANQATWIEWQHGRGAEAAMAWIHNGLTGPGHIPDEDAPYGKEAQAWFDANQAEPFPVCFCGRPSNQLWMGQGFCSAAHYQQRRAEQPPAPPIAIIPGAES